MKFLLLLIISLFLIQTSLSAQEEFFSQEKFISFVPTSFDEKFSKTVEIPLVNKYKALSIIGILLNSTKFSSPVDEFNALAPFDTRAYTPNSVSSFEFQLRRSYLLTNPTSFAQ